MRFRYSRTFNSYHGNKYVLTFQDNLTKFSKTTFNSAQLYQWTEFNCTLSIYFEEIGLMNQIESVWKLVIELDVGTIEIRYQQQDYIRNAKERCGRLTGNVQQTCQNIMKIIQKDETKLTLQLIHLRALYKTDR